MGPLPFPLNMAFLLKVIGYSNDIPNFPFAADADDPGTTIRTSLQLCWTLKQGKSTENPKEKVSIFSVALPKTTENEVLAEVVQNALRRSKSLMIPGFLKCRGATEYKGTVYVATEPCIPLEAILESPSKRMQYLGDTEAETTASIAHGLLTISTAVVALQQNRMFHGNIAVSSVFVQSQTGFWQLFGLEFVSSIDDGGAGGQGGDVYATALRRNMLPAYRTPPEILSSVVSSSATTLNANQANIVDKWGIACLLYEAMGVSQSEAADGRLRAIANSMSAVELRQQCRRTTPPPLQSFCSGLIAAGAIGDNLAKKDLTTLMSRCSFIQDHPYVCATRDLAEVLLIDRSQQVQLMERLAPLVGTFPLYPCLHYMLPRFAELVRTSIRGSSSGHPAPSVDGGASLGPVVGPVLHIAKRTSAGEDFDNFVTPALVQLFQSPDPLMRYRLLQQADIYGGKLSSASFNQVIWPLYAKGFTYSAPSVREYSARALVHFASCMSCPVLSEQVPRALAQLQRDTDGALRANATIALHLLSEMIEPPSLRARVMLQSCVPMLRDAFEPSRVAALRSLQATLSCMSAKQVVEALLPAIAPLAIDATSTDARSTTLALMGSALKVLESNHRQLTAAAQQQQQVISSPRPESSSAGSVALFSLRDSSSSHVGSDARELDTPLSTLAVPRSIHVDAGQIRPATGNVSPLPHKQAAGATTAGNSGSGVAAKASATATGWDDDDADDGWGKDDGWDDDGDNDSKWPSAPHGTTTAVKPPASASPSTLRHTTAPDISAVAQDPNTSQPRGESMTTVPSTFASPTLPSVTTSGPMKLRRKGGGLGAARLD